MFESRVLSREAMQAPEVHVPQAVVIDFDRTLSDVDAVMERLYNAAAFCDVDAGAVAAAQAETENDGGTFEPLSFIIKTLEPETLSKFYTHFVTAEGPSILYPDAQPFLDMLDTHNVPYAVLTYGVSAEWQRLKLAAAGYTGTYRIMDHSYKGQEMASWMKPSETGKNVFYLPRKGSSQIITDEACLIDDKATAFKSLEEGNTGFWVKRGGNLLKSQQGSTPPNVTTVNSLNELTVSNGRLAKVTNLPVRFKDQS